MRAEDVLCKEDNPVLSSEKRNETAWTQHSRFKNSFSINLQDGAETCIQTENECSDDTKKLFENVILVRFTMPCLSVKN